MCEKESLADSGPTYVKTAVSALQNRTLEDLRPQYPHSASVQDAVVLWYVSRPVRHIRSCWVSPRGAC